MARFPTSEPEILALAQAMVSGLTDNVTVYAAPPVTLADLGNLISTYVNEKNDTVAAQAAAEQATATKDEALQGLVDAMKADLRYAENTVDFDDDSLKLLGWGGRHAKTSLEEPGQPRSLEAPQQGDGWVFLDWKAPVDGGAVAAYKVQRRERASGPWSDVGLAVETEITLANQERGKEWEYQVIGVNKAGEGAPSNIAMAVL